MLPSAERQRRRGISEINVVSIDRINAGSVRIGWREVRHARLPLPDLHRLVKKQENGNYAKLRSCVRARTLTQSKTIHDRRPTYDIASRTYNIASRTYNIVSRTYDIASRTYDIVSRTHDIVSRIRHSKSYL